MKLSQTYIFCKLIEIYTQFFIPAFLNFEIRPVASLPVVFELYFFVRGVEFLIVNVDFTCFDCP